MSRTGAFFLGALGGLLPILVSLLTVDLAPIIDKYSALTTGNCVGYAVRVGVLLLLGGIMALLNSEVKQPFALVQLGIAAPALVTSFINGAPVKLPSTDRASFSIISVANAQDKVSPNVRLAGGFFSDLSSGFGTRLDQLDDVNRSAMGAMPERPADSTAKPFSNDVPIYSQGTAPMQSPPTGLGNICRTAAGNFPGPFNPIGSQCVVNTPFGAVVGFVSN